MSNLQFGNGNSLVGWLLWIMFKGPGCNDTIHSKIKEFKIWNILYTIYWINFILYTLKVISPTVSNILLHPELVNSAKQSCKIYWKLILFHSLLHLHFIELLKNRGMLRFVTELFCNVHKIVSLWDDLWTMKQKCADAMTFRFLILNTANAQ